MTYCYIATKTLKTASLRSYRIEVSWVIAILAEVVGIMCAMIQGEDCEVISMTFKRICDHEQWNTRLTTKKLISKFSSFLIEKLTRNPLRPFSSHENDSIKSYSHFNKDSFHLAYCRCQTLNAIFSKVDFHSTECFIIRSHI